MVWVFRGEVGGRYSQVSSKYSQVPNKKINLSHMGRGRVEQLASDWTY